MILDNTDLFIVRILAPSYASHMELGDNRNSLNVRAAECLYVAGLMRPGPLITMYWASYLIVGQL
jgi:hypothetical protein